MAPGISPFNPYIFTNDDFPAQFVTGRPNPNTSQKGTQEINKTSNKQSLRGPNNTDSNIWTCSPYSSHSTKENAQFSCTEPSASGTNGFNVEAVRPLPQDRTGIVSKRVEWMKVDNFNRYARKEGKRCGEVENEGKSRK
jgi:hypothetical protein